MNPDHFHRVFHELERIISGVNIHNLTKLRPGHLGRPGFDTDRHVIVFSRLKGRTERAFEKRQKELDQKQKDLQKEREELEKNGKSLPQEQLATRAEKWQREMAQVQSVFVEYNKELQQKQNELTGPIVQKVVGIIRRLATQEGYDMVLERQAATYFRSDLDLTDKVITLYNREGGGGKAPAKAPAAAPADPSMAAVGASSAACCCGVEDGAPGAFCGMPSGKG